MTLDLKAKAEEVENRIWYTDRGLKDREIGYENRLVLYQAFQEVQDATRRETILECSEICFRWMEHYALLQSKSNLGEVDGLYRKLASQDIRESILSLLTTPEKK